MKYALRKNVISEIAYFSLHILKVFLALVINWFSVLILIISYEYVEFLLQNLRNS